MEINRDMMFLMLFEVFMSDFVQSEFCMVLIARGYSGVVKGRINSTP